MAPLVRRLLTDDDGQDVGEYMLLGATIALAGLAVMNSFDDVIRVVYASWDAATQAIWEPQAPAP